MADVDLDVELEADDDFPLDTVGSGVWQHGVLMSMSLRRKVMAPAEFLAEHLDAARAVKAKYGVPVGALLAQAALETGWGNRVTGNAYFGIKGHAPDGASSSFQTTEVLHGQTIHEAQTFRAYTSFEDAAMDYGRFLRVNPRYAGCFAHVTDPVAFVQAVAKAGYSTSPIYGETLETIIRAHGLAQYDVVS